MLGIIYLKRIFFAFKNICDNIVVHCQSAIGFTIHNRILVNIAGTVFQIQCYNIYVCNYKILAPFVHNITVIINYSLQTEHGLPFLLMFSW